MLFFDWYATLLSDALNREKLRPLRDIPDWFYEEAYGMSYAPSIADFMRFLEGTPPQQQQELSKAG